MKNGEGMRKNYYGTVASLAWALGHYFYDSRHFAFLAGEFYPYRLKNPKSSSPYNIYDDIYRPWRDRDDHDKYINQLRLSIRGGVMKKHAEGVIASDVADRLKRICDEVDIEFFYPVVYRVNTLKVDPKRLEVAGSGLEGSSEYLIRDLQDSELDEILFLDFDADEDFREVITEEYYTCCENQTRRLTRDEALTILERRCNKSGVRYPISHP